MRYLLLAPKVEFIIGRHKTVDHSQLLIQDVENHLGITAYQFARFLEV